MNTTRNGSSRWITIGIVALIALLGLNGWLFYQNSQKDKINAQQADELVEAEKLNVELEKQYYETLSQLEEMRGDNEEMNALIDQQKAEISSQKDEIARMIRTTRDYTAVKSRMAEMESKVEEYLAELDALREANALLTEENSRLSEEKQFLEENLQEQIETNDDLTSAKAQLVNENSQLENQNKSLSSKVTKASVVPVDDVNVTGYKVNDSGKESRKRYAKNIDRLKICFEALPNEVTEPGSESFYIRIISPIGQTLAVEDMGSGILTLAEGDQVRFTAVKELDYNREAAEACLAWDPSMAFEKGNYQVEIYNKGHLAGTGTFRLR